MINGTGEILIGSGNNSIGGNADITIGPDITLRGYVGNFSPGSILVNQGTVHSDLPGTLTFGAAGMTVINDGVMKGTDGGSLSITGNWTNNASITIQDGGTLNLNGTYNNLGTIAATDSTVNLGGEFTMAGLGSLSRTGGSVRITGPWTMARDSFWMRPPGHGRLRVVGSLAARSTRWIALYSRPRGAAIPAPFWTV